MEAKSPMFVIKDEAHAEPQAGLFETRQQAIAELKRRAEIPWNEEPNRPPCTNWLNCGRRYELVEYDDAPWTELSRILMLKISATVCNGFLRNRDTDLPVPVLSCTAHQCSQ
jgi:hypothetical protein